MTDTELVTDENGEALLHGFKGEYRLSEGQNTADVTVGDRQGEFVWKA